MDRSEKVMKKILFTIIVALGAISSAAAFGPVRINTLVNEYKGTEGFDVVKIGPVGMGLLKIAATFSSDMDKEALTLLSSVKGLKGITIVDFEDARYKEDFARKLEKALEGTELFMEAKDGSETMRIYGTDDGKYLSDCILYSSDGALIFARGKVDIDRIMELAK